MFICKTGAKPVFPSKPDKDKPKFNVKGHKETTGYPLPNIKCVFWLSVESDVTEVWTPGFNIKIMLLSWATGSVSSGKLLVFDVIVRKAIGIVGDATGDT